MTNSSLNMTALERLLEFAPLTDEQLIVVANMCATEMNTMHMCPNNSDEIEQYLADLQEQWESICIRLVNRHPNESDFLSDNLICSET